MLGTVGTSTPAFSCGLAATVRGVTGPNNAGQKRGARAQCKQEALRCCGPLGGWQTYLALGHCLEMTYKRADQVRGKGRRHLVDGPRDSWKEIVSAECSDFT